MYHKKNNENTRTPQPDTYTPKNQFWQKWGPCTPNQCYGAAIGVLRPASLYNYEKMSNFKLTEITS